MSIATEIERLQTAKADIKAAIEEKGVTVGDGTIDTYAQKIGEISKGNLVYYATKLNNTFGGAIFPENFEFIARVKKCIDFGYMFNNCSNLKSVKIIHETRDTVVDMTAFCNISSGNTKTLELVDFTEFNKKFSNLFNAFYNQIKLKTILGTMDLSSCKNTVNAFSSCLVLEDIEFEPNTIPISISFANCSLLTNASIQSIIDGLADLTGGTAQTLTLHATVGAQLTNEQKAVITAKNWTLVY